MKSSLITCACLLLLIGTGGHVSAQSAALADDDAATVWLTAPDADAQPSKSDIGARKSLLKLIDDAQRDDYRRQYEIRVPEGASGLPPEYTIFLYRKYVSWRSGCRLEINVEDGKATAQLVNNKGIFAGDLPIETVDRLARELIYGFLAKEIEKDADPDVVNLSSRTYRFATHMPYATLEVVSNDRRRPLHLRTEAWQPNHGPDITVDNLGLRGVLHHRTHDALTKLASEQLKALPGDEQDRLILAGLRRLPVDEAEEPWHYSRNDLTAVEAVLYSHLAIERALAAALPELKRVRLNAEVKNRPSQ